jgi:hypothetical protein
MPKAKFNLTRNERQNYRRHLQGMRDTGVAVGDEGDFLPSDEVLLLEQLDRAEAAIFALPLGFVFVAPVRLTIPRSTVLIDDFEMTASWNNAPLKVDGPEHFSFYSDLIRHFHALPSVVLNSWITGERPLRRHRIDGLLLCESYVPIPSEYRHGSVHTLELSLWDDGGNCSSFSLEGCVDRKFYKNKLLTLKWHTHPRTPLFPAQRGKASDKGRRGPIPSEPVGTQEEASKRQSLARLARLCYATIMSDTTTRTNSER